MDSLRSAVLGDKVMIALAECNLYANNELRENEGPLSILADRGNTTELYSKYLSS